MAGVHFDFGVGRKGFIAWRYPGADKNQLCFTRPDLNVDQSMGPWKCYASADLTGELPYVARVLRHADLSTMRARAATVHELNETMFERELTALEYIHRGNATSDRHREARKYVVDLIGSGGIAGQCRYIVTAREGSTVINAVLAHQSARAVTPSVRERFSLATLRAFLALFRFIHNLDQESFLHGDVKPDNILCAGSTDVAAMELDQRILPEVAVIDFGHSGHTADSSGLLPPTIDLMAADLGNEPLRAGALYRLRNNEAGRRTIADDYFGLAVTTYALFTGGILPYTRENGAPAPTVGESAAALSQEVADHATGISGMVAWGALTMSWQHGQTTIDDITVPKPLRALWDAVFPFVTTPHAIDNRVSTGGERWWREICSYLDTNYGAALPSTRHPSRNLTGQRIGSPSDRRDSRNPGHHGGYSQNGATDFAREAAYILSGFIPRLFPLILTLTAPPPSSGRNTAGATSSRTPDSVPAAEPVAAGVGTSAPATPESDMLKGFLPPDAAERSEDPIVEEPIPAPTPTTPPKPKPVAALREGTAILGMFLGFALVPIGLMALVEHFIGVVPDNVDGHWQNSKLWWLLVVATIAAVAAVWMAGDEDNWIHPGHDVFSGVLVWLALPWTVLGGFAAVGWMYAEAGGPEWTWWHWALVAAVAVTLTAALVAVRLSVKLFNTTGRKRRSRYRRHMWGAIAAVVVLALISLTASAVLFAGSLATVSKQTLQSTVPLDCTDPYESTVPSARWCLSGASDWVSDPPLDDAQFAALTHPIGLLPMTLTNIETDQCRAGSARVSILAGSRDAVLAARGERGLPEIDTSATEVGIRDLVDGNVLRTDTGVSMLRSSSPGKDGTTTVYDSIGPSGGLSTAVTVLREPSECGDDAAFEALISGLQVRGSACVDYEEMDHNIGVSLTHLRKIAAVELCLPATSGWEFGTIEVRGDIWPNSGHVSLDLDTTRTGVGISFAEGDYPDRAQVVPGVFDLGLDTDGRWIARLLDTSNGQMRLASWINERPDDAQVHTVPGDDQVRNAAEYLTTITAN